MGFFRKKKTKKTVNFNLDITVELADNFTDDGTTNLDDEWWSEEDGASFQARDKRLALLMASKRLSPDALERDFGESSRGMELQFQENANVIVTRKTNSYNAVRSLQQLYAKREKKKGDEDKSIARAYSLCCEGAVMDAARLGEEDAKFVAENVLNEPDSKKMRESRCSAAPAARSSLKPAAPPTLPKKKKFFSLKSSRRV